MLKSRRRQLHASIAKVLVERFADDGRKPARGRRPPFHRGRACERGDRLLASRRVGLRRRDRPTARLSNPSSRRCISSRRCRRARERLEQAHRSSLRVRTALIQLGEFGRHRRLSARSRSSGQDAQRSTAARARCPFMMSHSLWNTGDLPEALAFGENAQAIAESLGDVPLQVTGNLHLGAACLGTGDYRQGRGRLCAGSSAWLEGDRRRERFGETRISCRGGPAIHLTWIFTEQEGSRKGSPTARKAVRLAEALDHPYSLAWACWVLARVQITKGEIGHGARLHRTGAGAVSRVEPDSFFSGLNTGGLGDAYARSGRIAEGISLLQQGLSALETMGHRLAQSFFLVPLGEAYVLRRPARGRARVRRASPHPCPRGRSTPSRSGGPLRLLGEVAARRDLPEQAEGHYRDALALAEQLGMRPLVAHCHLGLGKLYRRTGGAQAGAGARRHGGDDVPRDGHDVLAGAGGGGDASTTVELIPMRGRSQLHFIRARSQRCYFSSARCNNA